MVIKTALCTSLSSQITYKYTPGTQAETGKSEMTGFKEETTTTTTSATGNKYLNSASGNTLEAGGKMYGNSKGATNGYSFAQKGYSQSVQTYIKRGYYTAGLRLDRFIKESFTLEFRNAAKELAIRQYDYGAAVEFMLVYGNYGKTVKKWSTVAQHL